MLQAALLGADVPAASLVLVAAEAAAATGGTNTADWQAKGVSIDTRTIQPGDLFVALKDVRDGHDFVAQALAKGAAAALVSRIPEGLSADAPLLIVPDVLKALEDLGRAVGMSFEHPNDVVLERIKLAGA